MLFLTYSYLLVIAPMPMCVHTYNMKSQWPNIHRTYPMGNPWKLLTLPTSIVMGLIQTSEWRNSEEKKRKNGCGATWSLAGKEKRDRWK